MARRYSLALFLLFALASALYAPPSSATLSFVDAVTEAELAVICPLPVIVSVPDDVPDEDTPPQPAPLPMSKKTRAGARMLRAYAARVVGWLPSWASFAI